MSCRRSIVLARLFWSSSRPCRHNTWFPISPADNLQDRLQSITQQILSRTRLVRIIEKPKSLCRAAASRSTPDELVERMRKDIEIELVHDRDQLTAFNVYYSSRRPASGTASHKGTDRTSSSARIWKHGRNSPKIPLSSWRPTSRKPGSRSANRKTRYVSSRTNIWETCRDSCRAICRSWAVFRAQLTGANRMP